MTAHIRRRSWLVWTLVALAALAVAACGGGAVPSASPMSTPIATPTPMTTPLASPRPTGPSAVEGCPNFVEVVETGPIMGGEDQGEFGPLAQEQQRLNDDMEAAQAYGANHSAEFGSIRYENGPRVRIVIAFTDHLAEHCAALRELLAFPDEFELIFQGETVADLERIQQEIFDMARPFLMGVGQGAGVIHVSLRADGEAMAQQILDRYGAIVEITVGALPFPDAEVPEGWTCALPLDRIVEDTPFQASLQLSAAEVHSGGDFGGVVRVTNLGLVTVDFESGQPLTAMVFRPGTSDVVGIFTGGIAGTGIGRELEPLESIDINVLGGTASCDPALGYAVPPGQYEVRVLVDQYRMHANAPTEISYILSEPAPLTITP